MGLKVETPDVFNRLFPSFCHFLKGDTKKLIHANSKAQFIADQRLAAQGEILTSKLAGEECHSCGTCRKCL